MRATTSKRPASASASSAATYATTPRPVHTSRYPPTNSQVGTNVRPEERRLAAIRANISTIGATAGNIVAIIIGCPGVTVMWKGRAS